MQGEEIIKACVKYASEKKATDILGLDLRKISLVADYFVLCNAGNVNQAKAISDNIDEKMSEAGQRPFRTEGYKEGRWILLDFGSVVVHIFQEEERKYYNLERLWADAALVQLDIAD